MAQDDAAASSVPGSVPPSASPGASPAPSAAVGEAAADGAAAAEALLELVPIEAAGLPLREQATTFGLEELRANSAEQELAVLESLISAAGAPADGIGVAAVLATTADGAGGILLQVIEVPGMRPEDGITFWRAMLDLANETSTVGQLEVGGKNVPTYVSPADPDVLAHLYSVDGAAWLIIASEPDMLEDVFSRLP
jgi:hypothetical protein